MVLLGIDESVTIIWNMKAYIIVYMNALTVTRLPETVFQEVFLRETTQILILVDARQKFYAFIKISHMELL